MVNFATSGRCNNSTHCSLRLSETSSAMPEGVLKQGMMVRRVRPKEKPKLDSSTRRSFLCTSTDFLYERRTKSTMLSERSTKARTWSFISLPRWVDAMLMLLPEYRVRSFQSSMRSTICSSSVTSSLLGPTSLLCRRSQVSSLSALTWSASSTTGATGTLPSASSAAFAEALEAHIAAAMASFTSLISFWSFSFCRSTKMLQREHLTVIVSLTPRSSKDTALPSTSDWTSSQHDGFTMGIVIWRSSHWLSARTPEPLSWRGCELSVKEARRTRRPRRPRASTQVTARKPSNVQTTQARCEEVPRASPGFATANSLLSPTCISFSALGEGMV
mmetsp:Transcript_130837/g.279914  ORF Transcript_130837/g.279914 Transcript_130837/m.279914 type:complete len:331 (+) Transcript_130837:157-1149(+)